MKTVTLPGGESVPALGLGTWHMGERGSDRAAEADALRLGIDLGMTLIDTAEMYASGGSEEVVGDAIAGRRDGLFIVSKVLPYNADHTGTVEACEASLRRMGIETIDLYLLHWPGSSPLEETFGAFEQLQRDGKIRHWGVSNFDTGEMEDVQDAGRGNCATNQILYNLTRRGPEFDLLPWCDRKGMPVMAYSPLEQGRLGGHKALRPIADKHGVSDLTIALAWVLRRDGVIAIPKAARQEHVRANLAALEVALDDEDIAALDAAFPPPKAKKHLEIL
ncbi:MULTISPECIES: aldo/keto reductase [Thalassobaculum]|uniref:Aldo/keto reductase n=1 Tax=Thalassobaculum litoreum DSM 18839 TaxID=1123362 RepID=A0A8G2EY74_9PROT|nr:MULTISPECIES: aldo/keto reductase [Thalassobaculum]SDG46773.1 Aldo/keto reductase [Thalassobaculum litoreum DSM 18839]